MTTITEEQTQKAYELAKEAHKHGNEKTAAINELHKSYGMNEASAADYVNNLFKMLKGDIYHRTLNPYATRHYLENIALDFGEEAFQTALSAVEQHLDYYAALPNGGPQKQIRALVDSFKDDAIVGKTYSGANTAAPSGSAKPKRAETIILRIIRDNKVSMWVKQHHNYACQVCGESIETKTGPYAEGAHIVPLGAPYSGEDNPDNMLCLCPNHHVSFDRGGFSVRDDFTLIREKGKLRVLEDHDISISALKHHRQRFGFST